MKNVHWFVLIVFQLILVGCDIKLKTTFKTSPDSISQNSPVLITIKPKLFENIAIVTRESATENRMPLTAFSIEYPNGYDVEYYPEKGRYYIRLRQIKEGVVEKEVTIGRSQKINSDQQALQMLTRIDSAFSNYNSIYFKKIFIGKENIGKRNLFKLQSLINFDKLKIDYFRNDYLFTTVIIFPPNEELEGVNISLLKRGILKDGPNGYKGLTEEEVMILDSFSYIL